MAVKLVEDGDKQYQMIDVSTGKYVSYCDHSGCVSGALGTA